MIWLSLTSVLLWTFSFSEARSDVDVPVVLWASDRSSVSFPPAYAGHRVAGDAFARDYLDVILDSDTIHNVAIFVQDRLSVEDLRDVRTNDKEDTSSNPRHFASLQAVMDGSYGIILPAVTSAFEEIYATIIQQWNGNLVHNLSGSSFMLPPAPSSNSEAVGSADQSPCLFIVHLPTSYDQLNDGQNRTDNVVDVVIRHLEELGRPFVGLYTSKHSSEGRLDSTERRMASGSRGGHRRLMDTEVADGQTFLFINVSNCLYFYVENITFTLYGNSWQLPFNPRVNDSSYCANFSASLTMAFDNVAKELPSLSMTMVFTQTSGLNAGFWYMSNFSLSYDFVNGSIQKSDTIDIFPYFLSETPLGLSYSCSYLPQIPPLNVTNTGRGINITFQQLQVQAFSISNNQFGYYNDCVGFFNITIWCVLIVLFVLFIILADGVCMMMSLETCDRTDDPKGKTITIIASE